MSQLQEVDVSPYVASAIIEHAKCRCQASGYLLGVRNVDNIHVTDFIPMTNFPPYADVSSKAYVNELDRRVRAKQAFVSAKPIGWYAAGTRPEGMSPAQMKLWCEAPAATFAQRIPRQALYINCSLPDLSEMSVRWSAHIMRNQLVPDETDKAKYHTVCTRVLTLRVNLTFQDHVASNVFLNYVRNLVLSGGKSESNLNNNTNKSAYSRRELLNLDHVSWQAGGAVAEALLAVQGKLEGAITAAREAIAAPAAPSSAANAKSNEKHAKLLAQLECIHAIKEEDLETQYYASSREDVNTQRFKDALMIKCMVMLLRKEIAQIGALAHQYYDGNRQGQQNINTRNYV